MKLKIVLAIVKNRTWQRSGVSMTEFMLVVPVFITCFIAIVNIASIQRRGISTASATGVKLWESALPVEQGTDGKLRAMFTYAKLATAEHWLNLDGAIQHPLTTSNNFSTTLGTMKAGDYGESYGRLQFVGFYDHWTYARAPKPRGLPIRTKYDPSELVGDTTVGNRFYNSNSVGKFAWQNIFGFVTGARYGEVYAQDQASVSNSWGTFEAGFKANMLVAPYARPISFADNAIVIKPETITFLMLAGIPHKLVDKLPKIIGDFVNTPYSGVFGLSYKPHIEHHSQDTPHLKY